MSLSQLVTDLEIAHPSTRLSAQAKEIVDWITSYVNEKNKEYNANKDLGLITFGKFKGQSVKAVAGLEKGNEYLAWVSRQQWMTADKFPVLYPQLMAVLSKKP